MRNYQLVVVVKAAGEAERKKTMSFVTGLLKGLKVTKEEDLGSKALAYRIKKELTGHFYNVLLEGEKMPVDFEKRMMENDSVLRQLMLRTK